MKHSDMPRIAFTIGDINGIGAEVLLRGLMHEKTRRICQPLIVANTRLLREYLRVLLLHRHLSPLDVSVANEEVMIEGESYPIIEIDSDAELRLGHVDAGAGRLAGNAIVQATNMVMTGDADAIVTMPLSKVALHAGGHDFPGHTEMIASITGGTPLMVLMTEGLRVGLVTTHIPISSVPSLLASDLVTSRLRQLDRMLRKDFAIEQPFIAVLGLNPHAGEMGEIGHEEMEIIGPAIREGRQEGIGASGPHPADGFFARFTPGRYDAVLAMYHDQGLIPLKMFARGHGVNFTANLPIVRTSPDHGTAFAIAGQDVADESSVVEAIGVAVEVVRNRRSAA